MASPSISQSLCNTIVSMLPCFYAVYSQWCSPPLTVHQTLSKAHAQHLEHYWPLFIFGTMIEFVTFFLVHPDLFTLVVCLKTTILLGIWLGRDDRGGFVCRFVYHRFESKIDVKGYLAYHQTERKGNTPWRYRNGTCHRY